MIGHDVDDDLDAARVSRSDHVIEVVKRAETWVDIAVIRHNIGTYKQALLEQWEELPPIFITSSVDGRGRDELLDYIEELNKL